MNKNNLQENQTLPAKPFSILNITYSNKAENDEESVEQRKTRDIMKQKLLSIKESG